MKRSDLEHDGAAMIFDDEVDGYDNEMVDDGDSPQVFSMAGQNPDQWPHVILRGPAADLSPLHQMEAHSTFFVGPRAKLQETDGIPCRAEWQDGVSAIGEVHITQSQVLFMASDSSEAEKTSQDQDWAIGATCIHLHAMTDEPEVSVYLQLAEEGGDGESTLEVTLIPVDPQFCQSLFDGLCKLVARHPLELDDDDDGPNFGGGNFFMGGGGDSDDLIWSPAAAADRGGHGSAINIDSDMRDGEATEEERDAMLERLDNLLMVRPEFEVQDGQFDDAEEDEEEANSPQ